jgi:hypothetical protein
LKAVPRRRECHRVAHFFMIRDHAGGFSVSLRFLKRLLQRFR